MNILIYTAKKNPDVLKAERFFKERKIPYQMVDLKKQKISAKELALFARVLGAKELVDREGQRALERPVAHMSDENLILAELAADPNALRSPIVRNGNLVTIGTNEAEWKKWIQSNPNL